MSMNHEYNVDGHSRIKITFYIAFISITIASVLAKVILLVKTQFPFFPTISISSVTVFTILILLYSKRLWRIDWFCKLLKYPNLNGLYEIEGKSLKNPTGSEIEWNGFLHITQTWDKIQIALKTETSSSQSLSNMCKISHLEGLGYEVKYSYDNKPFAKENELNAHQGVCTITFDDNVDIGQAEYYNNGKERESRGVMNLRRVTI